MKIGYQGEKGAYSEAAMYNHYGNDVEAIGYETFEDVRNVYLVMELCEGGELFEQI